MTNTKNSIYETTFDPIYQAAIVFGLGLLIMLGGKLFHFLNIMTVSDLFPWMTAAAFILFYAMFNSIFSLSSKDMNKYWSRSILSYAALVLSSGGLAYLLSSIPIREAGSYYWIIIMLTFGYLVFLSMMSAMKKIVEFAQKEEWNSPKQRRRKNK